MNPKNLLFLFVFLTGFIFSNVQFSEKDILNVDEAFILNTKIEENKIIASWKIKPGYYLYKKSILIKNDNDLIEHNFISKNELVVFDEFFGETIIFKDFLQVDAKLRNIKLDKLKNIKVAYQGCAEGKYCYPKIVKSL